MEIEEEQFVIINNKTLAQHNATLFAGGTQAEADDMYRVFLSADPKLKDIISIVPSYHLDF